MFDFPNPPLTVGQQVTGPGGAIYQWDGTKWAALGGSGTYVNKSGDTMTGLLTLSGDPAVALGAATKQYADTKVAKAGDTMTGPLTLPGNAASALQAVPLQQLSPAFNDVGRNLIHNPLFNIGQRTGPFTINGYTADRWNLYTGAGNTTSVTRAALADADRTAIGDEAAIYALQAVITAASSANSVYVDHHIEGVRRLSGKTVTLSFWARMTSGSANMAYNLFQIFGSGGSPSAYTVVISGGALTPYMLTTTWYRFILPPITIPSAAGKTFGTNGDDNTIVRLYFSAATDESAVSPSHAPSMVQTGTFQVWGVQLEVGSAATQLEKPDPQQDLAKCQRFYQVFGNALIFAPYVNGAVSVDIDLPYNTQMRAVPTVTYANITYSNGSSLGTNAVGVNHIRPTFVASAAGGAYATADILLSADL